MTTPATQIAPEHWEIVSKLLLKHLPDKEIWAFGSRATGKARQYSDLDLAVISNEPLSITVSAALAEDFTESDLPWKVDIIDWATTSESFREVICQVRIVIQGKASCQN